MVPLFILSDLPFLFTGGLVFYFFPIWQLIQTFLFYGNQSNSLFECLMDFIEGTFNSLPLM